MKPVSTHNSHQSIRGSAAPRSLILAPARAITLRTREAGCLRVHMGRVWLTLDGPHAGPANDHGDMFLSEGDELTLAAGQRVVMESSGATATLPASYEWLPASGDGFARRLALAFAGACRTFKAHSSASRAQGAMASGDSKASSGAL